MGCRWCPTNVEFQFTDEGFGAGFIAGSFLVVASGDASDSSDGQLEFFDGLADQLGEWALPGIPRGFTFDHSGGIIVANHTGSWWVLIPDTDGDGVIDEEDAFPNNSLQWSDFDGDGFGDNNAPGAGGDGCPDTWGTSSIDRGGCPDSDGDEWSIPMTVSPFVSSEWVMETLGLQIQTNGVIQTVIRTEIRMTFKWIQTPV